MDTVYGWARQLGKTPIWYRKEHALFSYSPWYVAHVVKTFNGPLVQGQMLKNLSARQATRRVRSITGVFLRWWSGCITMAKLISFETRDGPVTPAYRKRVIRSIRRRAKRDTAYADGVRAAPTFRRLHDQKYSFEGIDKKILRELINKEDIFEWQNRPD